MSKLYFRFLITYYNFLAKTKELSECINGDVHWNADKTPSIFWDNQWIPICGHWFWNNDIGASKFCEKLGYDSGTIQKSTEKYSRDSFGLGQCNNDDPWPYCTGGGNSMVVGTVGNADCTPGPKVFIDCNGGATLSPRSCKGKGNYSL